MRINEILTSQEQINLVRLIMNTTLNALGQPTQPAKSNKSPVVQAVKGNRKPVGKAPKIPAPPAPKPFPAPKATAGPVQNSKIQLPKAPVSIGPKVSAKHQDAAQSEAMMPQRLQPVPTNLISPINKNPSRREKKELQDKNDLIHFLKNAQATR